MERSRVIDLCLIMLTYVVSFTNDKKKTLRRPESEGSTYSQTVV